MPLLPQREIHYRESIVPGYEATKIFVAEYWCLPYEEDSTAICDCEHKLNEQPLALLSTSRLTCEELCFVA